PTASGSSCRSVMARWAERHTLRAQAGRGSAVSCRPARWSYGGRSSRVPSFTCSRAGSALAAGEGMGEFLLHKPDQRDEFLFPLDGIFRIELEGADPVEPRPRQAFTVPAGLLPRPVVPVRSAVLMIEKAGVVATGD